MGRPIPGTPPPDLGELVRASDRLSFAYLERSTIHREANAITSTDEQGVLHIPAASLGALILGPGTRITHQAMMLLSESGSTVVWVGERGVRYYGHGRSLTHSARLLQLQAQAVSNQSARLRVARAMYSLRFPGENVSTLTMQQLRGREGARVRTMYRDNAIRANVEWNSRQYDPTNFDNSTLINKAISAATTCLYGVTHAVIVAIGCSPGLGFVHTGHNRSFVYDIADLYKAEIAIPAAFDATANNVDPDEIGSETRRLVRDAIYDGSIMTRCAADIKQLLTVGAGDNYNEDENVPDWEALQLWDGPNRYVTAGVSYSTEDTHSRHTPVHPTGATPAPGREQPHPLDHEEDDDAWYTTIESNPPWSS